MNKNSKIYVAGHEGLVGSNLVSLLKASGYHNVLLPSRNELDLTKQEEVFKFFFEHKPEYVFLLAAKMGGIADKIRYPAEFLYENLTIQNNVIWAAHQNDSKKLLYIGSAAAYPANCEQPMKEKFLMSGPLSETEAPYALAKIAGVKLCEKISSEYQKQFITCMPTNIYGEGEDFSKSGSLQVIPSLIDRMHKAKIAGDVQVSIWGSGNATRDFIYVGDLVAALLLLMETYEQNEIINLSSGQAITIKELANMIKGVVGYRGELFFDTSKPEGTPIRILETSKLRDIGFMCKVNMQDGIRKTYEFYRKNFAVKNVQN